jgi:hypothetical protein
LKGEKIDPQAMNRQSQAKPPSNLQNDKAGLWALIEQFTIAHSTNLARAGRYGEAEASIQAALHEREATPELLDLLARIHAQKGHWKEAEAAWTQALQLDPANESYSAGLKSISQGKVRRMLPRILIIVGAALLIVLGCLAGGRFIFFPPPLPAMITSTATLTLSLTQTPSPTQTLSPTQTPLPSPTQVISPTPVILTCRVITGIINGALNVRSGPDIHFPVVGGLPESELVVILGDSDIQATTGWMFIIREPDLKGWIHSSYCK